MIDNLYGLARLYAYARNAPYANNITAICERLVHADMGAAAAQRHMPQWYHNTVAEARKWLRDQEAALA